MSEQKIDKTFHGAYSEIERLTKVFRKGGRLEEAIMEVGGDPAYMNDVRTALDAAYDALEEAHYGALVHLEMEESVNEAAAKIACVECDEVSTAAAWKKNNGFCPKCKTSSQGVAESKAVKGKTLTEGVLDGDDEDGFMARSQLYFMAKDAIALHGIIDDRDNLEPWVQAKITNAAEGLDAVRRYTEYQAIKVQSQLPVPVEEATEYGMFSPEGNEAVDNVVSWIVELVSAGKLPVSEAHQELEDQLAHLSDNGHDEAMDTDVRERAARFLSNKLEDMDLNEGLQTETAEKRWKQTSMSPEAAAKEFGKENVRVKKGALRNGDDMVEVFVEGKKKQIDRNGDGKNDWEDVKLARKAAAAKAQKKPVEEELKVVAQDMFKNALSAAKKRAQ